MHSTTVSSEAPSAAAAAPASVRPYSPEVTKLMASADLVDVRDCLDALGFHPANRKIRQLQRLLRRFRIRTIAQVPAGRGVVRLMARSDRDRIVKRHLDLAAAEAAAQAGREQRRTEVRARRAKPTISPTSESELRVGALEAKVDRLESELRGNTQSITELIKCNNVLADRIARLIPAQST